MGVEGVFSGRAWERFHGWVYRAKEPVDFWFAIALYFLGAIWSIGYLLYKVYWLP